MSSEFYFHIVPAETSSKDTSKLFTRKFRGVQLADSFSLLNQYHVHVNIIKV